MHKKVLVCLPLNDAHRAALEASVPEFEFRFNALDDVHAEDVLWADVVLGNAPVSMISQNKHIEWFQSNSAGPDPYLKPGVLPEDCVVTNATGAYGLAISEWMLAMWLGIQKDMFLYRDLQNQREWAPIDRPVRGITGARVLCVGMGDIGSNFARRAHMLGAEVVGVRRVDGHLVGARIQQPADIRHLTHAAAHRERNEHLRGHRFNHRKDDVAVIGTRRDVEERQLIRPFAVVAPGNFHRIPGIPEINEIRALHHASGSDVKAGDDPLS